MIKLGPVFSALLVDEEGLLGGVIRTALSSVGCSEVSDRTSPDVVVVRTRGSHMDPVRRLARSYREAPLLVVCDEADMDRAFHAGATDVITMPLRSAELVARLRGALRTRVERTRRNLRERKISEAMHKLQQEKHDLERLVCVDSLTGLANRRHTLSLLDAEWRRASRDSSHMAVVMIDLDCFHAFNEMYGHLGGDACLQRVTEAMVTCLRRPSDFLGRYGGEEFLAVLPNTDAAGARLVAERLRLAVEALAIPHAGSACAKFVTITAGFASVEATAGLMLDVAIGAADAALRKAKVDGRNRIAGDAPVVTPSNICAAPWKRFDPVFTDPWFADRIPVFLGEMRQEAGTILAAARLNRLDRIRSIARRLKIGSHQYGFAEIRRIGDALERAVHGADRAAIATAADELLQYVTHVQVIYRRPLEAPMAMPAAQPARDRGAA